MRRYELELAACASTLPAFLLTPLYFYPTASTLFASVIHRDGLDQACFQTRRSSAVFQKYATLVDDTRGCCSRADCGMSVDATRAWEQKSRRSAPVNIHVSCRLQSTWKGSTLRSVHGQLLMVWRESTSAMRVSSPRYVPIFPHVGYAWTRWNQEM